MNLGLIKKFSEKRPGGLRKLATDSGMSEQNLHRCLRNNKIQASDLENVANILGVDIRVFFDIPNNSDTVVNGNGSVAVSGNNNVTNNAGESAVLQERVKLLEQLLEEKERLIKVLLNK